MRTKDYYKQEIAFLKERRNEYTEWGCTLELLPIVEILNVAINALEDELMKIEK